ncbi:hypothetical protein ACLOJK_025808 [Asimina triloba]
MAFGNGSAKLEQGLMERPLALEHRMDDVYDMFEEIKVQLGSQHMDNDTIQRGQAIKEDQLGLAWLGCDQEVWKRFGRLGRVNVDQTLFPIKQRREWDDHLQEVEWLLHTSTTSPYLLLKRGSSSGKPWDNQEDLCHLK